MNTAFIQDIERLISNPIHNKLHFPDVCAANMIAFERTITHNMTNPILVFVRQDIKDINNLRAYYLYEKEKTIYEIITIVVNNITHTYVKPFSYI